MLVVGIPRVENVPYVLVHAQRALKSSFGETLQEHAVARVDRGSEEGDGGADQLKRRRVRLDGQ